MSDEIVPGLFRLPIPLPHNALGSVNIYAVVGADGLRLIDCGWNEPETYTALVDELQQLGRQVSDIKELLVTHNHPDHIGQAKRLIQETGARLLLHRRDASAGDEDVADRQDRLAAMERWLQLNGLPPDQGEAIMQRIRRTPQRSPSYQPDVMLNGGEVLDWTPFHFEVIWTPGHAAGLVCLYEPQLQLLISSDHVLERISPNIGLYARQSGDPLGDYLDSLRRVRALPVKLVLPGHGAPFSDLGGRIDTLIEHHEQRLQEILDKLADNELTAYELASQLPWRRSAQGWQILETFDRLGALGETLAHLAYLVKQGQITQHEQYAHVGYQRTNAAM